MHFVAVTSGVKGPDSLRKRDYKRRLTSPRSPLLLQKLPVGDKKLPSWDSEAAPRRLKDRREEALVFQSEVQIRDDIQNQQQQCRERFLGRWYHVRHFYAIISEMMTARGNTMSSKGKLPRSGSPAATADSDDSAIPAPLHTLTAMAWVIDLAREFRQGFAAHNVTLAQLEIETGAALHLTLASARTSTSIAQIVTSLRHIFRAFQRQPGSTTIDYREVLSALSVLDRWREGERKMVARWFNEFAFPLAENSKTIGDMKMAVRGIEIQRILFSACGDVADEARMQPFVTDLLAAMGHRGRSYVSELIFWEYVDSHPKLLKTVKTQCWKRLTDDTRLNFYRDVYLHAKDRFVNEATRAIFENALGIWRTREPRQRFARWRIFVAYRKLVRQSDRHFRAISAAKLVRRFRSNCQRRQEMHGFVNMARRHRNISLLRFAFEPWAFFWRSMKVMHGAAWRRSERHDIHACQKRHWRCWIIFYEQAKARTAHCNKLAATFIATRHRKIMRSCLHTWLTYKQRQDEVAAAEIRGQNFQYDLFLFQQMEAESVAMELEDTLSAAVEARARATIERNRRRSFIDATNNLNAIRKLQKQKEERLQYKASLSRAAEQEAKQGWKAIAEQMAVEVRTSTLSWIASSADAKTRVHAEATRIFELDAKWIRNELDKDPNNAPARLMPPGCQWQVFLEAPHGIVTRKLTKAFYLNTVTYERHWCDEVVLEDCEGIAREVIIQQRIDEALARLSEKETAWVLQRRQDVAATRIQMMFYCRQARLVCRRIIRTTFVKRVDPISGQLVYFNMIRPQESRRRAPKLIGDDEPLIPVESSTWVYRKDIHGRGYYERIDTGESSWGPPDHYILCFRCSVYFVTRRMTASGARYCIGCYANFRCAATTTDTGDDLTTEEESEWTKMPVQPASCMVCRKLAADFVCADCNHDAMCTRCFHAVHNRLAKRTTHAPPISLVNRAAT